MHAYRTHTCGALRLTDAGQPARLSGGCIRERNHGQLLFVDLRNHCGVTQCVIDVSSPLFPAVGRAAAGKRRHVDRADCRPLARYRSTPSSTPVRSSSSSPTSRFSRRPSRCRFRSMPRPSTRKTCASPIVSSICGASGCTPTCMLRVQRHRLDPAAHDRAGLRRVSDADPDRQLARGRARLPGAEPAASRQILCAAAGAAAVQAIADGRRGSTAISRSRRAFATRPAAPTGRPASSTSSISRYRDQPDAVRFARLSECADLQQRQSSGG